MNYMTYKNNKNLYSYLFLIFLLFLAIIWLCINIKKDNYKEPFVPVLNHIYRPIMRDVRIFTTEGLKNIHHRKNKLLRRYGLM